MVTISENSVLELTITEPVFGINNASAILAQMNTAAHASSKNIEINLIHVAIIDSTAIATLVQFMRGIAGSRRTMILTNMDPELRKVFELLNLARFFTIKEKRPGA